MFPVVTVLSAEDIRAVAQYYASLPPPKPAPNNLLQRTRGKTGSGNTPLTSQPSPQRETSVGMEQDAPMRGGTQGGDDGNKLAPNVSADKTTSNTETSKPGRRTVPTLWPRLSDTTKVAIGRQDQLVGGGDPERGRSIIASGTHGCPACHTIPGIRVPKGIVGPPLGGISRRGFIAGQLPNRSDVLVAFLRNPPQLVPETGMPNVGLTLDEAQHIASYLYTLEASRERQ
jgi:cytochrome c2